MTTDSAGTDPPGRPSGIRAADRAADRTEAAQRGRDPSPLRASTATPSVAVLSPDFPIPELGRKRRVWIYLPPDYARTRERYPVLYMHDGQNLFDDATGFAGEWRVDETLDDLHAAGDPGVIVVGIDNGRERRMDEYSPWAHPRRGGGEGGRYVDFLVNTLKPYIDRHFRTLPGRRNTGIAGSSMGGLISLYAALEHPEVFGQAGIFSPALWFSDSIFDYARRFDPRRPRPRLYFVTGALEGERPEVYVQDQQRMVEALVAAGFRLGRDLVAFICEDGTHSESFWEREFPPAYRWLFGARVRADRVRGEEGPTDDREVHHARPRRGSGRRRNR